MKVKNKLRTIFFTILDFQIKIISSLYAVHTNMYMYSILKWYDVIAMQLSIVNNMTYVLGW